MSTVSAWCKSRSSNADVSVLSLLKISAQCLNARFVVTIVDVARAAGVSERTHSVAVGRLSAGQRRRASLAAHLARDAKLWLLDEPHAGLDQDGRDLLDGLVRQAVASGATVLLSSHELERAEALADRVVTIVGGTTDVPAPAGTPEEAVLVP